MATKKSNGVTKADLKLLERVFDMEVRSGAAGRVMPAQIKSKRLVKLAEDGFVEEGTITLGGRFPVKITGWFLTHLGRYTYCQSC